MRTREKVKYEWKRTLNKENTMKMERENRNTTKALGLGMAIAVMLSASANVWGEWYLTGDDVDINEAASWTGSDGNVYIEDGYTGWLDTEYSVGNPPPAVDHGFEVSDGHLEYRDGADYTHDEHLYKLRSTSTADDATVTVKPGASFAHNGTGDDYSGVNVGHTDTEGKFLVEGGSVDVAQRIQLGGLYGPHDLTASEGVGVFSVEGSDATTINAGAGFHVSRYSEVHFTLDSNGAVTPIDVGELGIYKDGADDSAGGVLEVDTSAFETDSGSVDLFNYSSLENTGDNSPFGTVNVIGSELKEGNGTDDLTYSLDYGEGDTSDSVTLTYNNIPEPTSALLLIVGVVGIGFARRRFRR